MDYTPQFKDIEVNDTIEGGGVVLTKESETIVGVTFESGIVLNVRQVVLFE